MQPFLKNSIIVLSRIQLFKSMEIEEEKQLVARAKYDRETFGRLFDFYYPKILNYLIRRTGDVELARDLSSETFFRALDKFWQFKWRSIPFSAWIFKIATNELNGYYRKSVKTNTLSLDFLQENSGFEITDNFDLLAELSAAEEELARHNLFLSVRKELVKLPLKYQEVISLKYFENKKIKEISQILGKKEGTIKSLLSRGLKSLSINMQPITEDSVILRANINQENICIN